MLLCRPALLHHSLNTRPLLLPRRHSRGAAASGARGHAAATAAAARHSAPMQQVDGSAVEQQAPLAAAEQGSAWRLLGTPRSQLTLDFTLPTGQSFRWRKTAPGEYTGVVGTRVVQLRQEADDVAWRVIARGAPLPGDAAAHAGFHAAHAGDAEALADYLNLGVDLAALYAEWAAADRRFAQVAPLIPGARMLRQDPTECLFQFICSQNNHISRIHGMVERLCAAYGTPLHVMPENNQVQRTEQQQQQLAGKGLEATPVSRKRSLEASSATGDADAAVAADLASGSSSSLEEEAPGTPTAGTAPPRSPRRPSKKRASAAATAAAAALAAVATPSPAAPAAFYSFPTLDQLAAATEDDLRALGFGYRAKFITAAVADLRARPGGGDAWLRSLRSVPAAEAAAALEELPGVGPKVAACVALFSLDKHDAIPVDTHVWQLATKYYAPRLAGKSLTKKLHAEVAAAFVDRFGARAGWAHSVLFISDLRQTQALLEDAGAA